MVFAALWGCEPRTVSGPLEQEAFVWQRDWSPAVVKAVQDAPMPSLLVLLAEVTWVDSAPTVAWTEADLPLLARRGQPIGVVVRAASFEPGRAEEMASVVAQCLARAVEAGVVVDEVHLDVDVPTAQLPAYPDWLTAARAVSDGRPLTYLARRHRESLAPRDTALEVLAREKDKDRDKRG